MITPNLDSRVAHIVEDIFLAGASGDEVTSVVVPVRKREIIDLIRTEAINLADSIIGKDRVLHSTTDLKEGVDVIDREDKAVFDFQVAQRIELAKYQNPNPVGPTGPEQVLNSNLSPNEE